MSFAEIFSGNAAADGRDFQFWFVGRLGEWASAGGVSFNSDAPSLRDTPHLEVKWGVHAAGQSRPEGWSPIADRTSLAILVRGRFALHFRDPVEPGLQSERHLSREGDYVIWREDVEHSWQALEDSVVLTIRWPGNPPHPSLGDDPVDAALP